MDRNEAITKIAEHELSLFPSRKRKDTIECIFITEYEIGDEDIATFPKELQEEICSGIMPDDYMDKKYDPIIIDDIKMSYIGVTNEFIKNKLIEIGYNPKIFKGDPEQLLPCPCCKYKTLGTRGEYDICPVCFWEDDGASNPESFSGPNHITLGEGRNNFNKYGACDEKALEHIDKQGKLKFKKSGA